MEKFGGFFTKKKKNVIVSHSDEKIILNQHAFLMRYWSMVGGVSANSLCQKVGFSLGVNRHSIYF